VVTQSCTTRHHDESAGRFARPSSGRGWMRRRVTDLHTFPNVPPDGPARAPDGGPLTLPQARLALTGTSQVCGRSFLTLEADWCEGR